MELETSENPHSFTVSSTHLEKHHNHSPSYPQPTPPMTTITGACYCQSTTYTITLPPSLPLPLSGTYDHSTDLRLSIGFHCTLYTLIPSKFFTTKESPTAKLISHTTSTSKTLSFCEKCGATLFFRDEEKDSIAVLVPTIDISASTVVSTGGERRVVTSVRELVAPKRHVFLEETFRGGVSRYMDDGLPRFAGKADGEIWKLEEDEENTKEEGDKELLNGGCYCGGVKFQIHRAGENYSEDVMLKEWVKPGRKFCASYCFCHSCRSVSGAPFWVWAFIPLQQIHFVADDTLCTYNSSKSSSRSVTRRFCSRCGCHLFFTSTYTDEKMWDVAIAALDQQACEEGWFEWRYRPGEDAVVDGYINSWKEGRMGFEGFGREYHREMVEEVVGGLRSEGVMG